MAKSKKDKEIVISLSVDKAQFEKDLSAIKKDLSTTGGELRTIQKQLKQEWSAKKFEQAMTLAKQRVADTEARVKLLKDRLQEIDKKGLNGELAEEVKDLKTQLTYAEQAAVSAKKELGEISKLNMENLRKELDKVSQNLTSFGKTMTMTVTAPIVAAGTAAFNLSSDMQESINKVSTVFGDSAQTIMDWSNTTLKSIGVANVTALDMSSYFGDMATSMGFTDEQAMQMSKSLVNLAGDVASFKNMSLEQVRTALAGVFTGETESIKRLGVVMTETNLKAYATKIGIGDIYDELDQASKISLRYQYVTDALSNSQGDFAKTIDSSANQVRLFQESAKQLGVTFGDEIAPMITPIISNINNLLQSVSELDSGTKEAIMKFATFAATLGPMLLVTGKAASGISALTTAIGTLIARKAADTAATGVQTAATEGATVAQTGLNTAMAANPIGAVITVIGTLIAVLGSLALTAWLTSEKTKTLNDSLNENAKSYQSAIDAAESSRTSSMSELEMAEKLIPRFEELNGKIEKTAGEKKELAGLVEQINGILPNSINLINAETGAYENNTAAALANAKAKIEANAAMARGTAAATSKSELEGSFGMTVEEAEAEAKKLRETANTLNNKFSETYKYGVSWTGGSNTDYTALKEAQDRLAALDGYTKKVTQYQKIIDDSAQQISGVGASASSGFTYSTIKSSSSASGTAKTAEELRLEAYKDLRSRFEYEYKMGYRTEASFYAKLSDLQSEYLSENSDEWRSVNLELKEYSEKLQEDSLARLKSYCEEVAQLNKDAADERIKQLEAEAAAYDKLAEKEEREKKLAEARKQLAFTSKKLDDENYRELEKYVAKLEKENAEQEYKANIEAQKEAIQANASAVAQQIQTQLDSISAAMGGSTTNNYSNIIGAPVINAGGLSVAQAEQMIQEAMRKLLNNI